MNRKTRAAALAVAMAGLGNAAWAKNFDFTPVAITPARGAGDMIAIGDVNHDGRDDLLNIVWPPVPLDGSPWNFYVGLRLQNGDGSLAAPVPLAIPLVFMMSVEAEDIDGDGLKEAIIGHRGGVSVFRWNGAEFVPTTRASQYDCQYIALADLDGNGTKDIACNAWSGAVSTFLVDAEGNVGEPTYIQTVVGDGNARQIKLDDVSGDGRADLLVADSAIWAFIVHQNDGAGGFLPGRAFTYPRFMNGMSAHSVDAIDVDGDGKLEVVVPFTERVLVFRRTGANLATFEYWKQLPVGQGSDGLDKCDVDGNGYPDLMVLHRGWSTVTRFMAGANGLSSVPLTTNNLDVGGEIAYFACGDLNGDGRTDFAVNHWGFQFMLKYGLPRRPRDVTGDWFSDVLWRSTTGGTVLWPGAYVESQQVLPNVAAPWTVVAIDDFDGDDKGDLFWRNPSNGANMIWRAGNATTTMSTVAVATPWKVMGTGDFDGDERADLLWRNTSTGVNSIWLSGRHDTKRTMQTEADLNWQIAGVGDFDGDDRDDVFWRNAATGANRIWLSADASTQIAITTVTNLQWKVAGVGDFNRDGIDDLLWRNGSTGANTIWRSANVATQQAVPIVTNLSWKIAAVGDFRGDGMDDILWRNSNGGNLLWNDASSAQQFTLGTTGSNWQVVP